jgi:hypothetical protein
LSEHRFSNVSNLVSITRILKLLGLDTNRYLWQHDANADTGDAMMVGLIRLPTRSWFLWSLAMLNISHFIYIKDDASEILIIGPTEPVEALLRVSNLSANRKATEDELTRLRMAFGLEGMPHSRELKCMWLERLIGLSILISLMCSAFCARFLFLFAIVAMLCVGLSIHAAIHSPSEIWTFVRSTFRCLLPRCLRRVNLLQANTDNDVEAILLETINAADLEIVESPEEITSAVSHYETDLMEQRNLQGPRLMNEDVRYNIVIARQTWFEISIQREFPVASSSMQDIVVATNSCPNLYALPMLDALPYRVAPRVLTTDNLLYVCVHNPMVDINLVEMRELINKADRNIVLVVILPAVQLLERDLELPQKMRLHGNKETRYMASFADLHAWLMLLGSGIFSSLTLLLPYASLESLQDSQVWSIAKSTLTTNILTSSQ